MPSTRKAVVYWSRETPDSEEEFEITISVGPAEPRGSPYAGSREVEVITARDHHGCREDVLDIIPDKDLERLYSEAIEQIAADDAAAWDDEQERRAEDARDRRRSDW